jgi:GNAT superfamily N-acetyltransferase
MDKTPIFPMCEGDVPEARTLMGQLGYLMSEDELRERFRTVLRLPDHAVLVWKEDGLLGLMHLKEEVTLASGRRVEIKALVVSDSARSKGIGKYLVQAARNWAKERGCSMLYLSCNIKREKAHAFYQREGFSLAKTQHNFERTV